MHSPTSASPIRYAKTDSPQLAYDRGRAIGLLDGRHASPRPAPTTYGTRQARAWRKGYDDGRLASPIRTPRPSPVPMLGLILTPGLVCLAALALIGGRL